MPDPNRAHESASAEGAPAPSGFDVNAAAAEVLGDSAPATARGPWSAADYGWDPADANAVAWAAYYSDLGVDPAALAAQQAAEAAAAAPAEARDGAVDLTASDAAGAPSAEATSAAASPIAAPEPASEPASAPAALELEGDGAPVAALAPDAGFLDAPVPLDVPAIDLASPELGPSDAADGGSAVWELLPAAPSEAALPEATIDPELDGALPAGWSADGARLDELRLAGGGSFDEATAPIGDLLGAGEEDGSAPLDGFSLGLPPLEAALEELAPAAAAPPAAPPGAPLELEASAAEVAVDLGFVEDELAPAGETPPAPAPAAAPVAAPLALDFDFDLDLEAPAAEPAPAEPRPGAELEVDLGWAAHAVPAGDAAVDLASFDAEPQLEAPRTAPDATAMWGLSGSRPDAAAELLGDAAPLPTPAIAEGAELGEPLDGSLFLEPVGPAAAPAVDPWDAPAPAAPPLEVALAEAGPFDLGALDEPGQEPVESAAPPPPPVEPPEPILEVGDEVVEIEADAPAPVAAPARADPGPLAAAVALPSPPEPEAVPAVEPEPATPEVAAAPDPAPAPAEVAAPPEPGPAVAASAQPSRPPASAPVATTPPAVAAVRLPPAAPPAPVMAPTAPVAPPAPAAAAAAAPASPAPAVDDASSFVSGSHRVVVHTADGQVKRGILRDAALDGAELQLLPQVGSAPEPLEAARVKAIFFMLATGETAPEPTGKKVRVTFRDGRQVAGFSPDYAPERVGFFMVPADTRTHTARIWVYRASVRQVTVT